MYEIKQGEREVLGNDVVTWTAEFLNANVLAVEVGTTGYMGGDYGHGGRTVFRLQDLGGTAMWVDGTETEEVLIEFGGDTELQTFIQSLEFALQVLKEATENK